MSPRTKTQFETIREEKRSLIMETALEHFAGEGYHKTTITHLAKHAGISKGLMYNYFESKEALLSAIIDKSMSEIAEYFDPDKDGILTEDEFELFVRRYFKVIRDKVKFWRLYFQLMLQKEVREQFMVNYSGKPEFKVRDQNKYTIFKTDMARIISDYFTRKKERMPEDYDPLIDLNMFIYSMTGFATVTIYTETLDEKFFEKSITRIIELYK
ncbi:MAG TPA: TetR/AcrR family transcriptional regulator [Bacteroidales bacterium]|nr:TetR/AcrR family transcriptional regulator [Bacteroidales bacterium]